MVYESSNGWNFDFTRMVCWNRKAVLRTYLLIKESGGSIHFLDPNENYWEFLRTDGKKVNEAYTEYFMRKVVLGDEE